MATVRENLEAAMRAAAEACDFERAARLRDELRAITDADAAAARGDIFLPAPGAMGLGSSRQTVTPPAGWTPPRRPDPLTSGRARRRRRG